MVHAERIHGSTWQCSSQMIVDSINRMNGTKSNTVTHGVLGIILFGIIGGILTLVGSTSSEDKD